MFEQNFTCCFTGHREILPEHEQALPRLLDKTLRALISEGYTTFVSGGALGFDTMAAESVLRLKAKFPHIKLIIVAPFAGQSEKWGHSDRLKYERLRDASDDYICLAAGYFRGCMRNRNRYIVEISSACVAYSFRERSGSSQTVGFARENGLRVIDLVPLIEGK